MKSLFRVFIFFFILRPPSLSPTFPSPTLFGSLSRDLKKRGFTFVGPTLTYAYLQSMGLVDDHLATCWKRKA